MWLVLLAIVALLIGNQMVTWGTTEQRENEPGSDAALKGNRFVNRGIIVSVASGALLIVALWKSAGDFVPLFAISAVLLIVGNKIGDRGLEISRAHEYGSIAARRGQLAISVGTIINIIGGICLIIAVCSWLFG